MLSEPAVAYRNTILLLLLPTYLITPLHVEFYFSVPWAPSSKKTRGGAHFNASVPGAENPSYATVVFMSMFMFSCFSFLRNLLMNTFEPLARISSS